MKTTEQRTMLSQAHRITRRWLNEQINNGNFNEKTVGVYTYLNLVERNIYKAWHQNCLEDMKRIKLQDSLPNLFEFVATPSVTVVAALARARKTYASEKNKTRQKQIGKMVAMLTRLENSEKQLYNEATEQLLAGKTKNVLESLATKIEHTDGILNEYRLYTKQSIKHYTRLQKLGAQPSVHELYQCLDARFAGDADIFTQQVNIVCSTYDGQDVPANVKDICFNYIVQSLEYAGYLHANLIDYIFKNDEITERAFALFEKADAKIHSCGMSVLPATYAHRLAEKKGLYDKPAADLTDSDVRILRIERMFKK